MKCSRCNRPLSPTNTTGIGPVCARMVFAGGVGSAPIFAKCHLLGRRPDGSRRYLILTDGKEFRVLLDEGLKTGRTYGECSCRVPFCRHIAAAIAKEKGNEKRF